MEFQVTQDGLQAFAAQFWKLAGNKKVFAFHGAMGAGKTTVISALCRYRGTRDVTGSPTFSIINQYETAGGEKIYHLDLYRLRDESEVVGAGVEECIYSGSVCMVEWPEKAPYLFEDAVHIHIEPVSESERKLTITGNEG